MAFRIVKQHSTLAVVKVWGNTTETIQIAGLGTANIIGVTWQLANGIDCEISRAGELCFTLWQNGELNLTNGGLIENTNNDHDVVINIGGDGVVFVTLRKLSEFTIGVTEVPLSLQYSLDVDNETFHANSGYIPLISF